MNYHSALSPSPAYQFPDWLFTLRDPSDTKLYEGTLPYACRFRDVAPPPNHFVALAPTRRQKQVPNRSGERQRIWGEQ